MILTLLWLTVSTPFICASQQESTRMEKKEKAATAPLAGTEEESSNPFGNNTEEKVPGTNSLSEEFLHEHHITHYFVSVGCTYHKCENADTYTAFHGELLIPPPNCLS